MVPEFSRNVHDEVLAVLNRLVPYAGEQRDLPMSVELEVLGIDSMKAIDLLLEIEEQFQIAIPDDLLMRENFSTGDKIVSLVTSLMEDCGSDAMS